MLVLKPSKLITELPRAFDKFRDIFSINSISNIYFEGIKSNTATSPSLVISNYTSATTIFVFSISQACLGVWKVEGDSLSNLHRTDNARGNLMAYFDKENSYLTLQYSDKGEEVTKTLDAAILALQFDKVDPSEILSKIQTSYSKNNYYNNSNGKAEIVFQSEYAEYDYILFASSNNFAIYDLTDTSEPLLSVIKNKKVSFDFYQGYPRIVASSGKIYGGSIIPIKDGES